MKLSKLNWIPASEVLPVEQRDAQLIVRTDCGLEIGRFYSDGSGIDVENTAIEYAVIEESFAIVPEEHKPDFRQAVIMPLVPGWRFVPERMTDRQKHEAKMLRDPSVRDVYEVAVQHAPEPPVEIIAYDIECKVFTRDLPEELLDVVPESRHPMVREEIKKMFASDWQRVFDQAGKFNGRK